MEWRFPASTVLLVVGKKLRKCEVILLSQLTIYHQVGMKIEFNSHQALQSTQLSLPTTPESTDDLSKLTTKADNIESSVINHASLTSPNSKKISSSDVISYSQSMGRKTDDSPIQDSNVLSDISGNHTSDTGKTMVDNSEVCSTDTSTELLSKSDHITDQSSKKSKRIILCDETFIEEIFSEDDSCPKKCHSDLTLWITFDRHILQMTDKVVLENGELSDRHIQMAQSIVKKQFPLMGGLRNTLLQG